MPVGWKHHQLTHTLTEHLKINPPMLNNGKEMLGPALIQSMHIFEAAIIHMFRKTVILYHVTFQANNFLESLVTNLTLVCHPIKRVGVKPNIGRSQMAASNTSHQLLRCQVALNKRLLSEIVLLIRI